MPIALHRLAAAAAAVATLCAVCGPASATARTASGTTSGGIGWTAQSMIVGTGSTATLVAGGDPIYTVAPPLNGGLIALTMNYGGNLFICTGTLLEDRRSILTAAHCVTDSALKLPDATTASFYGGTDPDTRVDLSPVSTRIAVESYSIPSQYTGDVIDQNDIAVLRLAEAAPAFAPSFGLYTGALDGADFTVMGYGSRSTVGGSIGSHLPTGRLRQGDNRYEFRMGDSVFGGGWVDLTGEPLAQIEHSWLADFDSGLAGNDGACLSLNIAFSLAADPRWCNLGRGFSEATLAGGDSGGPGFIDGRIASISSYGFTFDGPGYGDVDDTLNSSFGEFSGYVPVYLHTAFIAAAMAVPEPGTSSMGLAGLVALGAWLRRRNGRQVA
jgi:Trypsin/PEP-CTERM motif